LRGRYPDLPYTLAGFSFGSRIALRLGCGVPSGSPSDDTATARPARIIAVGFPTAYRDRANLEGCVTPRIFIQSTHDEFGAVEDLRATFEPLPEPKRLIFIDAQDHYFNGGLERLEEEVERLG
jgi:alpha/beta superfamily hydrolase